jgi:hypothetical protein
VARSAAVEEDETKRRATINRRHGPVWRTAGGV